MGGGREGVGWGGGGGWGGEEVGGGEGVGGGRGIGPANFPGAVLLVRGYIGNLISKLRDNKSNTK